MHYSLLIYQTESQFAERTDPARREAANGAFGRYVRTLQEAGVLLTTLGIEPPETTTTVHCGSGAPHEQVGPYADATAQLGGVCIIEAPDHDTAVAWAKRAPFDHCHVVEVRPTRIVPSA